jgi:uncharacterized protein YukE
MSDERREARRRRRARRIRRRKELNKSLERFGHINWDVYTHRHMWDMVKSARPSEMGSKAYTWADLASKADAATEEVRKTAQRLLMSWRGESAVTAANAISELTKWGAEASGTARTIGDRLDTYTHAVQEAQRRMPTPVHPQAEEWFKEGKDVTTLDGPNGAYMLEQLLDDQQPSIREKQRRKAEAVEVMQSYEGTSRSVHDDLPQFREGPDGVSAGAVAATPSAPTPSQPLGELPADPSPAGTGSGSSGYGSTVAAGVPGAAGLPGGAGNAYGALPGGGQAGFGANPGGGAAAGGGFGAAPGGGPGALGGGVLAPGPQTGAGSGSAAAAAQRAAAGVRGGAGAGFGMMPPGAGGQRGGDDVEHHDKYGLGLDLMDDMPPAYPAVFGDD